MAVSEPLWPDHTVNQNLQVRSKNGSVEAIIHSHPTGYSQSSCFRRDSRWRFLVIQRACPPVSLATIPKTAKLQKSICSIDSLSEQQIGQRGFLKHFFLSKLPLQPLRNCSQTLQHCGYVFCSHILQHCGHMLERCGPTFQRCVHVPKHCGHGLQSCSCKLNGRSFDARGT